MFLCAGSAHQEITTGELRQKQGGFERERAWDFPRAQGLADDGKRFHALSVVDEAGGKRAERLRAERLGIARGQEGGG